MLGTDNVGEIGEAGDADRVERPGLKKEVNLDDVLEKDEERLWGTEVPLAVNDCDGVLEFDAPFRTILPPPSEIMHRQTETNADGCQLVN